MSGRVWLLGALMLWFILGGALACTARGASAPSAGGVQVIPTSGGAPGAVSLVATTQATGISVSGEGKVTIVPDVAILRLGVEARAATVELARSQAAEAMEKVLARLKARGVAEKDVQTIRLNIYPERRFRKDEERDVVVGYVASNMVVAKLRKVEEAGTTVDQVAKAGGDLIRVEGLTFTVDNPSQYHSQAREKAVADARAKAEQLAQLSGVKLGRPIFIAEGGAVLPLPRQALEAFGKGGDLGGEAPTPIAPGETELRLTLQVVYAIE